MQPVNPDGLRKWALTVEDRLGNSMWIEIARSMQATRRVKDTYLRQKCLDDIALVTDQGWKPTNEPCPCGWGEHTLIEVNGAQMCPVDMYLRLGRLALWGYRDLPTTALYWAMLNKEKPKDDERPTD